MTLGGRKAVKWGLWLLLLFALAGLQGAPALASPVSPVLVAAMAVAVLLSESRAVPACGFAALAGLLWDITAGRLLGCYGLMLLAAGAAACWLLEGYLRRTAAVAVCLAVGITFLCKLLDAELYLFIWGYAGEDPWPVIGQAALQSLLTGLSAWPAFLLTRFIGRRAMGEEPSSLRLRQPFTPEKPRGRRR